MCDGSDGEREALTGDDIWATEYHNQYSATCCDTTRKLDTNEACHAEADIQYPRLVQRDGATRVSLKESKHGSRSTRRSLYCAGLSSTFQTMINWDFPRIVLAFFATYSFAFLVFGLMIYAQNGSTDDFVGVNHNLLHCMAFAAITISTIGYGDQAPANEAGSIIPVVAVLCGILMGCFFTGLITCRLFNPRNLTNTLLFSNRAIISSKLDDARGGLCKQDCPRMFECRMVNLRHGLPWTHCYIQVYYVAFRSHRPVFENLKVTNQDVPVFMDLPWYIIHEITPESPLYNLSLEDLATERGEIVVEIEGCDPLAGNGMKKRFSYVAAELFVEHQFYDVLSLDSDGSFVVDLTDFHRTKPMYVAELEKSLSLGVDGKANQLENTYYPA